MQRKILSRERDHERGQTILLVAISLVSLLAMAALAIDVVTLYVARSEIQRAADAAALAAAKAIADSGVTSLNAGDPNLLAAQSLAQSMATAAVTALINPSSTTNLVAGAPPTLNTLTPIPVDFGRQGNPHVTISLQKSSLPTFFSKVWPGTTPPSVTATATAEVYNPANLSTITPIAPLSVKPWLVANADPTSTAPQFVDTTSPNWVVDSGVIGKSFDLVSDCNHPAPNKCHPKDDPPIAIPLTSQVEYVPAVVTTPNTQNICNTSCAGGGDDYEQSIACADVSTSYQVLNCGGGTAQAQWDDGINPGITGNNDTSLGGQCLIHASGEGAGQGQDTLTEPSTIFSAPYQIKQNSGTLVTTSNSIVTIPILDTHLGVKLPHGGGSVTVVGFLQAFINWVEIGAPAPAPPEGSINITVLNIAGCSSSNNGANPVVGGSGSSPIPVRLITPP